MANEFEEINAILDKKVVPSPDGVGRTVRFLRPTVLSTSEAEEVHAVYKVGKWPPNVSFKGWKNPQKKWGEWIEQMVPLYGNMWKQLGIHNAIMSSKYKICIDKKLILGLAEFWCSETNTFVFGWGESTVTLEDMLILGGFTLLGDPVNTPLSPELLDIEKSLNDYHFKLNQTSSKKASYGEWISKFMESHSKFEHVAFLTLWLSRFVFPAHPEGAVGKHVFPIAIHLANGNAIAIGPAVLASIYRDLRLLKQNFVASRRSIISVWGPLQLVQMWGWEHFLFIKRTNPNPLVCNEPRAARWHNVKSDMKVSVADILKVQDNFHWRPYTVSINNWNLPAFYKEKDEMLNDQEEDRELQNFAHCLRPCILVGIDHTTEKYHPHRVARQFGYDQDLPGHFSLDTTYEAAWKSSIKNAKYFARSRLSESSVTSRYSDWWQKLELDCQSIKKQDKDDDSRNDEDKLPLSKVLKCQSSVENKESASDKSPLFDTKPNLIHETNNNTEQKNNNIIDLVDSDDDEELCQLSQSVNQTKRKMGTNCQNRETNGTRTAPRKTLKKDAGTRMRKD